MSKKKKSKFHYCNHRTPEPGEVWYVGDGLTMGYEMWPDRYAVVLSKPDFNRHTVSVVYLTTSFNRDCSDVCVRSVCERPGAGHYSLVVCEQPTTVDVRRLHRRVNRVTSGCFGQIKRGVRLVLGL